MISNANAMDKTCMHFINLTKIVLRSACLEAQKGEMRWKREKWGEKGRNCSWPLLFILTSSHKLLPSRRGSNFTFKVNRTNFSWLILSSFQTLYCKLRLPSFVLQTSSHKPCILNFVFQTSPYKLRRTNFILQTSYCNNCVPNCLDCSDWALSCRLPLMQPY